MGVATSILNKVRFGLITLLAGKSHVALNLEISPKGMVLDQGNSGIIRGCHFKDMEAAIVLRGSNG